MGVKYTCSHCKYKTKSRSVLKEHTEMKHMNYVRKCDQCDFTTTRNLCDKCPFEAKNSETIREHLESKHEGIAYNCDHCGFKTLRSRELRSHMNKVHKSGLKVVKPKQSGSGPYITTNSIFLNRHVSNIIVLVPANERELHEPQQVQVGRDGDDVQHDM